jgi:LuxR family transcriptional regulator, maltose regulon positive regulatory protein
VQPGPLVWQGLARLASGDLDGADESFADAVSVGEQAGAHEALAVALCERSLVGMARNQWDRAEDLADQARAVVRRSRLDEPVVYPVLARAALRRGDVPAVRQHLVAAQRVRPTLTYAMPVLAVQVRVELARVHLALADLAGARTLMLEIDEVLRRRPGLGTLVGDVQALRDRLAHERGSSSLGASALTAAELRLLPLLSTHLSFPEIAAELFVSRNTIKTQVLSIYRKLGASSRNQAVGQARELGLLEG